MNIEKELSKINGYLKDPTLVYSPETLRSTLRSRGYSYESFSNKSGLSISTISNWCKGKASLSPSKIFLIASFLQCSPADFFISVDAEPASQEWVFDNRKFEQTLSEKGILNQDLAIKIGCHPNTIGYWKKGYNKKNPNRYLLGLAAKELEKPLESFFVKRELTDETS